MTQTPAIATQKFHLTHRYLHVPIKNKAPEVSLTFSLAGQYVTSMDIEAGTLADHDWIAVCSLPMWTGQVYDVSAQPATDLAQLLAQWFCADEIKVQVIDDCCRPELHFTSQRGWINDPNGLVYYNDQYHLFYQHNPYGRDWGNMHWGHAVSNDLIHWQERDDELHPDANGFMYSGSAVVDQANTSGLQQHPAHPPICLFYTAAGNMQQHQVEYTQRLAYSIDGGIHWEKHKGPQLVPTITTSNRDPKVFFHTPTSKWVMTLYLEKRKGLQWFQILTSSDLLHWEPTSQVSMPGCGECPDLFELPLDGENGNKKWVFWSADGTYLLGHFDGDTYVTQQGPLCAYNGNTSPSKFNYAAQTFSNLPNSKCIQLTWLRGDFPNHTLFNQQLSLPVQLTLKSTPQGPRLAFMPICELDAMFQKVLPTPPELDGESFWEYPISGILLLQARLELHNDTQLQLTIGQRIIMIDIVAIRSGDTLAHLPTSCFTFSIYIDTASVEIFACDGLVHMPLFRMPQASGEDYLKLRIKGQSGKIRNLSLHTIK